MRLLRPACEGKDDTGSRYGAEMISTGTLHPWFPAIRIATEQEKTLSLSYESTALSQAPATLYPAQAARWRPLGLFL